MNVWAIRVPCIPDVTTRREVIPALVTMDTNWMGKFAIVMLTIPCVGFMKQYYGYISDVNECSRPESCAKDFVCEDTPGSYLCKCKKGYQQSDDSICKGLYYVYFFL